MPIITLTPFIYAAVFFISLIIGWMIDGFAVRVATRFVTGKRISLSRGMLVALVSIVVFAILFIIFSIFTPIVGLIVALIGMIYVVKRLVYTSWFGGFGVALVAWIILVIIYAIIAFLFGGIAYTNVFHHM